MNTEKFFQELSMSGHIWVAMENFNVLSFRNKGGKPDLPVWACKESVIEFLENSDFYKSCRPVEIPLEIFKTSCLSGEAASVNFEELIINPNGKSAKDLVLTKEEFINYLWH